MGILSTRGRHDWAAPVLWLAAVVKLLILRMTAGQSAVLVHLSAKGSFVREGSLVVLSRWIGHRVGIHMHGSQFPDFSGRYPRLVRRVCSSAISVFVLTDESADIVRRATEGRKTRVIRVRNVVDIPDLVHTKSNDVLFGGEVGRRKGADVLLSAWQQLGSERAGWTLTLAGPVTPEIKAMLPRENVKVLGAVPHAELLRLQSRAAIAVLPSRNEAMPMFLLESMARACAVVSTPVGQVRELVQGVGDLVDVGDVNGLANALSGLLRDSERLQLAGARARQRATELYSPVGAQELLETEWGRLARGERAHG
jgi:glycosyltransferase involved in cell wall biosynthesis